MTMDRLSEVHDDITHPVRAAAEGGSSQEGKARGSSA